MINLSLIQDILANRNDISLIKHVLKIIEDILLRINQDKIDQLKSKVEFKDEVLEIEFYSKENSCCPIFIDSEGNNVNILIGIGEAIYLDNACVKDEKDMANLKACIEDLFYLPIEESITFKNNRVLSSSCIIKQLINGNLVPVEYKHTKVFSFFPLFKKKVSHMFDKWI